MEDFVCGFGPACGYLKRHQCAFKHPGAPFQNLTIEELIPRLLELERKQAQTFLSVLNLKRRPQHRHNRHQQAFRRPFDRRPIVVSSSPPLLPLPASVPVRPFSPAPVLPRSSAWPPVSFASVVASAEVFTPASFPVLPPRRGDDVLSPSSPSLSPPSPAVSPSQEATLSPALDVAPLLHVVPPTSSSASPPLTLKRKEVTTPDLSRVPVSPVLPPSKLKKLAVSPAPIPCVLSLPLKELVAAFASQSESDEPAVPPAPSSVVVPPPVSSVVPSLVEEVITLPVSSPSETTVSPPASVTCSPLFP